MRAATTAGPTIIDTQIGSSDPVAGAVVGDATGVGVSSGMSSATIADTDGAGIAIWSA